MKRFQFQTSHTLLAVVIVALVLGWFIDHQRQQSKINTLSEAYSVVRTRLDGLVREVEFQTELSIEEDQHALWIISPGGGGRLPITGEKQQPIDASSPAGKMIMDAIQQD